MHIYKCAHAHTYIYIHMAIFTYIYIYIHTCIYIYINVHVNGAVTDLIKVSVLLIATATLTSILHSAWFYIGK